MGTTVRKIFDLAAAILFENYGGDADFVQYSPALLEHAPEITAIDETVLDWDDAICKNALVHGLASALMADDSNKKSEALIEYNKYAQALEDAAPAIAGYSDEAD